MSKKRTRFFNLNDKKELAQAERMRNRLYNEYDNVQVVRCKHGGTTKIYLECWND